MRDQIAQIIFDNHRNDDGDWNETAKEIIAAIPDMIAPLDMPERRNNYWGHKHGYQVAHTSADFYRVRLNGRVICKDIKGFSRAIEWANAHHRAAIMAAMMQGVE
jgi:hypothetical protein